MMDVCLPADFLIADDDYREPMRYVDEGPASYEDGYWLGGEALVSPLPLNPPRPGARRKRGAAVTDDPSWQVV